jgi:hypothetical protein
MRNLLGATFLTVLMSSCTFIRMDDSIDLGNKYRYIQDYPQVIIYNTSSESKGSGVNIVPPVVKSYAFNDRYIIAKSQEVDEMTGNPEGKPIHYWIVDKTSKGASVEPMDSTAFYAALKVKQIKLSLE